MKTKTEIVLDADVIIHFAKGGWLATLPSIFPEYEYILLDYVREEIKGDLRRQLDFQIQTLRNITPVAFEQTGEIIHEYARLHRTFGKGESACMAYCRFHNNVLGSSNLRDILTYCETNGITYLTTVDFLYYAVRRNIMTRQQADDFILQVNAKGSRLPVINWNTYVSQTIL